MYILQFFPLLTAHNLRIDKIKKKEQYCSSLFIQLLVVLKARLQHRLLRQVVLLQIRCK